ncbi:MAG: DUF1287 domain-containing protein [Pseudobutyrivibrio sp.]|nr:DUF1287 domain-containing protein [Pseudobutyrivibrio sp.]
MSKTKKRIIFIIVSVIVGVGIYFAYRYNYIPHRKFDADKFNISTIKSHTDADTDGIDDYTDILKSAKKYVATKPRYKSKYYSDTGYSYDEYGVCTDVVATALKNSGYDLMELVNADVEANPKDYDIDEPDKYIDFRRVKNLKVYFKHTATELTKDINDYKSWQPGDIVIWEKHIGLISDSRNSKGQPFVIHNANPIQASYEEDILSTYGKIVGHYRITDEFLWSIEDKKDYKTKLNIPEMGGEVELVIPSNPEEHNWNFYLKKDKDNLGKGKTIKLPKEDDDFVDKYMSPNDFGEYDYLCDTNLGIAKVGDNKNFYSLTQEFFVYETPKAISEIEVCDFNYDNITDIVILGADENDQKRLWYFAGYIYDDFGQGNEAEYMKDALAVHNLYGVEALTDHEAEENDIDLYNYEAIEDIRKEENNNQNDLKEKMLQAYLCLVNRLDSVHSKYALIDFDGDEYPELFVDDFYECIAIYTYGSGRLEQIYYGFFGDDYRDSNGHLKGLEYSPGNNSIKDNVNTNKSFYCLVPEYGEVSNFFIHTDGLYHSNTQLIDDESVIKDVVEKCDTYDYESLKIDQPNYEMRKELERALKD